MNYDKHYFREHFFKLERYRVSADKRSQDELETNEATVRIIVPANTAAGVNRMFEAENPPEDRKFAALTASAEGDGPVDALDRALRKILEPLYPFLSDINLIKYTVSNTFHGKGTSSEVGVFILASNSYGKLYYSDVTSKSVVEASFFALANIYNRFFVDEREASEKKRGSK